MADASQGAQAKLCVEPLAAPHTFDTSSEPYEFISESIQKTGTNLDTEGIRGTRSHSKERTRRGTHEVGGSITINPSPADLDLWLPRILGAAESADSFALAETLPVFGVLVDRVAQTFEYTDCKVNRAVFRSSAGGLLELELDIMAKTEATGTSYPVLTLGTAANNAPYVMSDGVFTFVSAARKTMDIEIEIDNQLSRRFTNSVTATDITPQDRVVTIRCTNPFTSDETSLYGQAQGGVTATAVYTNGGMSTTFTFAVVQFPDLSPTVGGKTEIPLVLEGIARMSGATKELVVTHDSAA